MAKTRNKMSRRDRLEQTKNRNELNAEQAFNLIDRNNQARVDNSMSEVADRMKRAVDRKIGISLGGQTVSYLGETPKEYFKGDLIDASRFEAVSMINEGDENFISLINHKIYSGLGVPEQYLNTGITSDSTVTTAQNTRINSDSFGGKVEMDPNGNTSYVSSDGRRVIISCPSTNIPNHIPTFPNTYGNYMGQDVYRDPNGSLYMVDEYGDKKLLGNSASTWQPSRQFQNDLRREIKRMSNANTTYIQHVNIYCSKDDLMDELSVRIKKDNLDVQERATNQGKKILYITQTVVSGNNTYTVNAQGYTNGSPDHCKLLVEISEFDDTMVCIKKMALKTQTYIANLSLEMHQTLACLAGVHNGDYVGSYEGNNEMIIEGKEFKCSTRIMKENQPIEYSTDIPKDIMNFKKSIKEYIADNPDLAESIKGLTMPDNTNIIAKHVLQKKINEEISYEDFYAVFVQTCMIGVTDKMASNMYALLKQ